LTAGCPTRSSCTLRYEPISAGPPLHTGREDGGHAAKRLLSRLHRLAGNVDFHDALLGDNQRHGGSVVEAAVASASRWRSASRVWPLTPSTPTWGKITCPSGLTTVVWLTCRCCRAHTPQRAYPLGRSRSWADRCVHHGRPHSTAPSSPAEHRGRGSPPSGGTGAFVPGVPLDCVVVPPPKSAAGIARLNTFAPNRGSLAHSSCGCTTKRRGAP